jgi:hypothetical protein
MGQEDFPVGGRGTSIAEIRHNGLPDFVWYWQQTLARGLLRPNERGAIVPINIVELQTRRFLCSYAQPCDQEQQGVVATATGRTIRQMRIPGTAASKPLGRMPQNTR